MTSGLELAGPKGATILARRGRRIMDVSSFVYQNDSKVINISQRRSGDDRISQCLEEFMAIICIKAGSGAHPLRKGLVQGVRLHEGSSYLSNDIHRPCRP